MEANEVKIGDRVAYRKMDGDERRVCLADVIALNDEVEHPFKRGEKAREQGVSLNVHDVRGTHLVEHVPLSEIFPCEPENFDPDNVWSEGIDQKAVAEQQRKLKAQLAALDAQQAKADAKKAKAAKKADK